MPDPQHIQQPLERILPIKAATINRDSLLLLEHTRDLNGWGKYEKNADITETFTFFEDKAGKSKGFKAFFGEKVKVLNSLLYEGGGAK